MISGGTSMNYSYSIIKSSICKLDLTKDEDYVHVYFVLSGNVKMLRKGKTLIYKTGEFFIQKPDKIPLEIEVNKGCIIYLAIHKNYFEKYYMKNTLNTENNFEIHHHIKDSFMNIIRNMYEKNYLEADICFIKMLNYLRVYLEIFDNYLFRPTLSKTINEIIEYINDNYKEPLKLCVVARELFYNESFISRKFKEEMNVTFTEYLTNVRLCNLAEYLIVRGEDNGIWEEFGFPSQRAFLKRFKETYHMTPREFILSTQYYRNPQHAITESVYTEVMKYLQYDKSSVNEMS
ncbi:AraC family transcriptional regulator [Staphylococcus condimenti]|nr:AraC family transcriptional regulator [Staphylococcus condimenti]